MIADEINSRMLALADTAQARHLARFFKCGEGEYGFGDRFLGIKVPVTRSIVKECRNTAVGIDDCRRLITSEWHEVRLAGFLLLIELYRKAVKQKDASGIREIVDAYIELIPYGNNWDLVDLVCPSMLGDWLVDNPQQRHILDDFAGMAHSLWHQRVAIVATLPLIKASSYDATIRIAERYLSHRHDLIHKATGWMLREMGKRGGYDRLISFLDRHATTMPRTALRYAIERMPEELRQHYLKKRA